MLASNSSGSGSAQFRRKVRRFRRKPGRRAEPGQVQQGSGEGSRRKSRRLWYRVGSGSTEVQQSLFPALGFAGFTKICKSVKIKRCSFWGHHRGLFFILEMKCLKRFFFICHFWKSVREYHCVLRGPIQTEEQGILGRQKLSFKFAWSRWERLQKNACWSSKSHVEKAYKHFFLNAATSIREVLPGWNLWCKHDASTGKYVQA